MNIRDAAADRHRRIRPRGPGRVGVFWPPAVRSACVKMSPRQDGRLMSTSDASSRMNPHDVDDLKSGAQQVIGFC